MRSYYWTGSFVGDQLGSDDGFSQLGVVRKESAAASPLSLCYLVWMFVSFVAGLTVLALAPVL